ncbi:MAG: MATE family efflux transporter [Planctomycetota bacterium]
MPTDTDHTGDAPQEPLAPAPAARATLVATVAPPPDGQIRSGKLAGKSVPAAIVIIALPVLCEQFANAFVGLVDQVIAGSLPADVVKPALDGIGVGTYVGWFINICISAIGIGAAALIARAMGAGDRELSHSTLAQGCTLGLIWGGIVGIILWLVAPLIATFLGLAPASAGYFVQYVRVLACGLPVTAVMLVSMNSLHGAGETTRPFLIMIVVNIVNVVASWWLAGVPVVIGGIRLASPPGAPLHVVGIALGTVIAQAVGAVLMIVLMRRGIRDLRLEWSRLPVQRALFWRLARIGVPGFLEGIGLWFGNLCVLSVIGVIAAGNAGLVGAHSMAIRWESFAFLPGFAFGTAAAALGGQFLGAGNPSRAARAIWSCALLGAAFQGLCGLAFIFCGTQLTAIISRDPFHLDLVPRLLFLGGIAQVPFGLAMVLRVALRGVGDVKVVMAISWITTWCIRLPIAWFVGVYLGHGIIGVWIVLSTELWFRASMFVARMLHGGWKTVRV